MKEGLQYCRTVGLVWAGVPNKLARQTDWSLPQPKKVIDVSTRANAALYQVLDDILIVTMVFVEQADLYDCFDYSLWVISSSIEASCVTYHNGCSGTKSPVRLRPINQVRSARRPLFCCTLLRWHHPVWSLSLKIQRVCVCLCSTEEWREKLGPWS